MSRSSSPADTADPVSALAAQLNELRNRSRMSYRMLSAKTNYSRSTLASAVGGDRLPSWSVVAAYVRACGGDEPEWRARWDEARARHRGQDQRRAPLPSASTPEPPTAADLDSVATPADLTAALKQLWTASGQASMRQLAADSGNVLGRATIHDLLNGVRAKPEWSTVWKLIRVLHGPDEIPDRAAWRAAWGRAREWAESESRRPLSRAPVRSCTPVTLGVHPALGSAADQPPYIDRDIGTEVRGAVSAASENSGFILLVGEEGSGKTRLAYETLCSEAPDFGLFVPVSEEDFHRPLPARTVVWLDNFDQYLNWKSLTPLAMQAIVNSSGPVIVMATMCIKRYNDSVALPDPAPQEDQQRRREVLSQASVFTTPVRLSDTELSRAWRKQKDSPLSVALDAEDPELFRTLASGPHIARRWATADPYARAVITAAADTRRVGISGPLQRHLLCDAAACYLSPLNRDQAAPDWFAKALVYASAPVPGGLAPLVPDSPRTEQGEALAYRPAGYLLWLRDTDEHRELPEITELGRELKAVDFTGPVYHAAERALARYATDILSNWPPPSATRSADHYAGRHRHPEHHDDAWKLAMETVDEVLPTFRAKLVNGSWKPGDSESLAACFMALCRDILRTTSSQIADSGSETEPQPRSETSVASSPAGSSVIRIILGDHLQRQREAAGVTRKAAAGKIGVSEPGLGHIEIGRSSVRVSDVLALLTLYRTDAHQREDLLALAEQADRPEWWYRYHDIVPEWFQAYAGLERVSQSIRIYEQQFIPGLLQTEEYASAVISLCGYPPREARKHVEFRRERQQRLRGGDLELWAVLDEAVLRRTIAGPDAQVRQLERLIQQIEEHPQMAIQIVPYRAEGYPVPAGFSILRFAESYLPDVVYIEHLTSALYLDKPTDTDRYRAALERLAGVASTPAQTTKIIQQIIRDISGARGRSG